MTRITLSRRNLLALSLGFIVIIAVGISISIASALVVRNILRTESVENFGTALYQQPYLTYSWILKSLGYISLIVGGFIVGWIVRRNGLLYGGILGLVLRLLSVALAFLILLIPTSIIYGPNTPLDFRRDQNLQNILNILLYSPITIILTAFGGWIGGYIYKRQK